MKLANEDKDAVEQDIANPRVVDRIVCLNAQQAIEKALKALLLANSVDFNLDDHSLAYLLSRLEDDAHIQIPDSLWDLKHLRLCAGEIRYGEIHFSRVGVKRDNLLNVVEEVMGWVNDNWPD